MWDGQDLAGLLRLSPGPDGTCRSLCNEANRSGRGRVFGGQLLGQALAAAASLGHRRPPTLLQAVFLSGASVADAIDYRPVLLQDGKRFTSCAVKAAQGSRIVLQANATFHAFGDRGVEHHLRLDEPVPAPESLPADALAANDPMTMMTLKPFMEMRLVDADQHLLRPAPRNRVRFWIRVTSPLSDDPLEHAACLAYLSDFWLSLSAITRHMPIVGAVRRLNLASLNHSLWLHRPVRADQWLLVVSEGPHAQDGRGIAEARYFDREGLLAASATQECLMTWRDPPPSPTT